MDFWKLFLRKTKTLIGLSQKEQRLLVQGLILLPLVGISLHLFGFQWTQKSLQKLPFSLAQVPDQSRDLTVLQTARMVRIAAQYCQPWAKCLQQSLVLSTLLYHQGIPQQLKIGVNRDQGKFTAHAWVEYQGFPLNQSEDVHQQFSVFKQPLEVKR